MLGWEGLREGLGVDHGRGGGGTGGRGGECEEWRAKQARKGLELETDDLCK